MADLGTSTAPLDDEVNVGKDDERRRQDRPLFVLHHDGEPVELPDLQTEKFPFQFSNKSD